MQRDAFLFMLFWWQYMEKGPSSTSMLQIFGAKVWFSKQGLEYTCDQSTWCVRLLLISDQRDNFLKPKYDALLTFLQIRNINVVRQFNIAKSWPIFYSIMLFKVIL